MDEKYLNVSLDDIYDELINYNISLQELASIYEFPSETILEKALRNYCKQFVLPLPKQIESPEEFFTEEEEEIHRLREEENISIREIADRYGISAYSVNKILKRFEKVGETSNKRIF